MGRKKLYHERMIASFPDGTFKRIHKVLERHEDRTDFIRTWVEYGIEFIKLRKKASSPSTQSEGQVKEG